MLMSVSILSPLVVRLFVLDMIYNTRTILLSSRSLTAPSRASGPGRDVRTEAPRLGPQPLRLRAGSMLSLL